jgi:phage baseplate assembly protein W
MKSISIPFRFTSDSGAVATSSSLNTVVEQNIIDILTTMPGERVMNPKYGAGLKNLLFEEMDELVFAEYRVDAIQELNEYLTTGKVVDLNIVVPETSFYGDDTDTTITVSVKYVVPPFGASVVTFEIANGDTTLLGGAYQ